MSNAGLKNKDKLKRRKLNGRGTRTGPIKKGSKTVEERLINIEIKLANQEHLIDQLNIIIYEQQMKIDRLERVVKELEKANTLEVGQHNVKPPHY